MKGEGHSKEAARTLTTGGVSAEVAQQTVAKVVRARSEAVLFSLAAICSILHLSNSNPNYSAARCR